MPLLGQKIYLAKSQEKRKQKKKGTFEIPFTNEVFTSKDDYDQQMQCYKQPIWACQCTGFAGLTYEEALSSETEVRRRLESKFPKILEKSVLELVHHRAAPLDVIVDEAQQHVQSTFEVGETVELKVKVRGKIIRGKILQGKQMSEDELPTSDKENSVSDDHPYSSPHKAQNKYAMFHYSVQLEGEDKIISAIPGKDLVRTLSLPSRDLLQLFIRASAVQAGIKPSSPWVVTEELVKKFSLSSKINEVMLSPYKVNPSNLVKMTSMKRPADSQATASKSKKRKLSENNSSVSKLKQSSLTGFSKKENMVLSVVLQREPNTNIMGLNSNTMIPPVHNPNIMSSPEKVQLDHSYSSPLPHLKAASRNSQKKEKSPKKEKSSSSSSKMDKKDKKEKKAHISKKSKSSHDKKVTAKSSKPKSHHKQTSKKKIEPPDSESEDVVVIDEEVHKTSKLTKSNKSGKTECEQDDIIIVDYFPVGSEKKNENKLNKASDKPDSKKLPTKRKLTDHFSMALLAADLVISPSKNKFSRASSGSPKSPTSPKSPKSKTVKKIPMKAEKVKSSSSEELCDQDKMKHSATAKSQSSQKTKKTKETSKKHAPKKIQLKQSSSQKSAANKLKSKKTTSLKTSEKDAPQKATTLKDTKKKLKTPEKTSRKSTPSKSTPKKLSTKKSTPVKVTPSKSPSKKVTPKKSISVKTSTNSTLKKTPKKSTPAKKSTPGKSPDDTKNKKPFKQATLFDVGAKKNAEKESGKNLVTKVASPKKGPRQLPIANKMFRIKSKNKDLYLKLVRKAARELNEKQVNNLRVEIRDDVLIKFKERMEKIKWQTMTPEEREKIMLLRKEEMRNRKNELRRKKAEANRKERQKKAEELRILKTEQAKRFEDQDLDIKPLPVPKLVSMPEGLPNTLFGDIAMVVEFINCYNGLLMPDDPYPVTADSLMKALVCGKEGFAYLARVLVILLKTLLQDEIAEDYRELSVKLSDITVNMHTSSELLRMSLRRSDHDHADDRSDCSDSSNEDDNDVPYSIVEKLETCEFFELEAEEKLQILVCVCHRIMGSYAIQDFMEGKQKAAANLWKEKMQSLKEKNDKIREEKQKKKEQKEAEKLEKEKLKEKEEQQSEDKDNLAEDKSKGDGEVTADKTKKKKSKTKKGDKAEVNEVKPVEDASVPDEELDLASVVKRRRLLAAKVKAEKVEQDKLNKERRMRDLEVLRKQKDEQQFQKNFEDGIQLAKLTLRQCPVGTDRNHNRYWIFSTVTPGLFIEKGWADKDVGYCPLTMANEEDTEIEFGKKSKDTEHTIPKIGQNLWFQYSGVKEIDALLEALDNQGIRESALHTELKKRYVDITKMTFLSRRSGPDLRDSDGPKELLDSYREDLSDIELNVRQGELGGVKNFEKWEKKLQSNTKLRELGLLMIECQDGINSKFLQGILAPAKAKIQANLEEDKDNNDASSEPDVLQKSEKLLKWIEAVKNAPTLSRLHMLLAIFETCVKWEKSAANAKCKICRKTKGDNKLLLCDECNMPFHMFCLRPALMAVPKGEWKCPGCSPVERRVSRNRPYYGENSSDDQEESSTDDSDNDDTCAVCEEDGELVECYHCPSSYHRECHDPPLKNFPRGYWKCSECTKPSRKTKKARQKRAAERRRQQEMEESKTQRGRRLKQSPAESKKSIKGSKKSAIESKKSCKMVVFDSEVAESIISKLMCYRGSAPFRTSPDRAEAPDYDEMIKIPMDLHMLKNKCSNDEYQSYESFFADVKLIFSNAHEYYEESDYIRKQATKLEDYFLNQVKWAIPDLVNVWETVDQQDATSSQQNGPTGQRRSGRNSRR